MYLTVILLKIITLAIMVQMTQPQTAAVMYKIQHLTRIILKTEHSFNTVFIGMEFTELIKAICGNKLPFFIMC